MKKNLVAFSLLILGVFYFYDYQISSALAFSLPLFSNIFAIIGLIPLFLGFILYGGMKYRTSKEERLYFLISHFGIFATFIMLLFQLNIFSVFNLGLSLLISILLNKLYLRILFKFKKETLLKFKKEFLFYLFVSMTSFLLVTLFKEIFGRIRYIDLNSVDDFETFLQLKPFSGNRSFPSGHTIAASNLLSLNLIFIKMSISKAKKNIFFIFSILFVLLTAFSRITLGVHYASDVLVSILIFSFSFNYYYKLIIKNDKKMEKVKKEVVISQNMIF